MLESKQIINAYIQFNIILRKILIVWNIYDKAYNEYLLCIFLEQYMYMWNVSS